MNYKHVPVMLEEILKYLNPLPGQNFIDCTLGGGGYTTEIAKRIGNGKIISIDLDQEAINCVAKKIKEEKINNIILVRENFKNLKDIIAEYWQGKGDFSGIVLDLGVSSHQFDCAERGFSFQHDAPLDMRFGENSLSAEDIVNIWKEKDLEMIFKNYGEERYAKRIAAEIVRARRTDKIKTTNDLVEAIKKVVPNSYINNKKIHFATRVFQGLRIAVNHELENLKEVLPQAVNALAPSGKIATVSFHSLEDRIIKQFFKKESKDCLCSPEAPACRCGHVAELKIITKKAICPEDIEIKDNPRSRSAKLRVAQKI
ncbi:MAG: 16S rRNA (cytosine(1402)-N(4))-methyltransferase RsmH [bacterium]